MGWNPFKRRPSTGSTGGSTTTTTTPDAPATTTSRTGRVMAGLSVVGGLAAIPASLLTGGIGLGALGLPSLGDMQGGARTAVIVIVVIVALMVCLMLMRMLFR